MDPTRVTAPDPQRPTPELLLWAYARGIFPMFDPESRRIEWFSPDPRAVIELDGFHVPRTLVRRVRQRRFEIRAGTAFEAVMRACGDHRPDRSSTWIDDRLVRAYAGLFARGHAQSVEAWRGGRLVGGLYGVVLGGAFFGESMFVRPELDGRDASKVCLVHLVRHLHRRRFTLLDVQFWNPHLEQFGCVEIPRVEYLRRLQAALESPATWGAWDDEVA